MLVSLKAKLSLHHTLLRPFLLIIAAVLLATPVTAFAQAADNLDCTLIVPADPLTPTGLATPYQFKATNPANGPCDELNKNQSAFVQGAIINIDTGQIS